MGWLVIASLFFYGWWNPLFLWLILLSVTVNFVTGTHHFRTPSRSILILGIAFNLSLLGYFKYAGFLTGIIFDAIDSTFRLGYILLTLGFLINPARGGKLDGKPRWPLESGQCESLGLGLFKRF